MLEGTEPRPADTAAIIDLGAAVPPGMLPAPRVGVVLAAGRSERLQEITGGGSKALVRLGGLALVARAVRILLAHGLERVVVVVGYHAGPVAAVAGRAAPGRVRIVVAEDWEDGNGASLAAAERALQGEGSFVAVTADHVFSDEGLAGLLTAGAPAVLVDASPSPEVWQEATRVEVGAEGRVVRVGKAVASPVVDCGAFLLGPEIFQAIRRARAAGSAALAAGIDELARAEGIRAHPLPAGAWWQDVDTPSDLRKARRLLRRSLRRPTDGPISRLINRRISVPISLMIAPARPNPDMLSVVAFLVGAGAAIALASGRGLLGGILAQACSVLDGVDGEVARLTVRAGRKGALLDGFLDRVGDVAVCAGLGIWAVGTGAEPVTVVLLTAGATAGAILSMATKDRVAALGLEAPSERRLGWLMGGRDGRLATITVLAGLGMPQTALAVTAATALVAAALRVGFARHPPPTTPA